MKNVPNILSSLRILAAVAMVIVYFTAPDPHSTIAILYIASAITDVADGYIARKYNAITNLGRVLDPMGDKLTAAVVLGCLALDRIIPWWAFALIFLKDALMAIGGLLIHRKFKFDVPASAVLGKAATVVLFSVGVSCLLFDIPRQVVDVLSAVTVCMAFMAFGGYFLTFRSLSKKFRSNKENDAD